MVIWQFVIENDPVEIVDLAIENSGIFPVRYVNVYQRVFYVIVGLFDL